MKPFIPSWLDDLGLSLPEFRLYCHFCRRAGKDGIAWTNAETIRAVCRVSRNTVWPVIEGLEKRHLLKRLGKPFGKANRYQVLAPIGTNETPIDTSSIGPNGAPIDTSSIGPNGAPIETFPIGPNGAPPIGPNEGRQSDQMERRKGNPKKVIQRRLSNTLMENIWNMTPPKGRERSSRKKLAEALRKSKSLPPEDEIILSLDSWKKSESWTKDNGKWIPGIHRWVNDEKWEITPTATANGRAQCIKENLTVNPI